MKPTTSSHLMSSMKRTTRVQTCTQALQMNHYSKRFLPKMAVDFGILKDYPNITVDLKSTKSKRDIGVIYRKNNQQEENIKKLAQLLIKK